MEVGVFEPRPRSSNRIACSVHGCKSKSHKNLELIFHNLPKKNARLVYIKNIFGGMEKIDQLKAWRNALKMGKEVSKNASVCSLHFRKKDYISPNASSQKRRLKTTAVPSCNLPRNSIDTSKKNEKLKIAREERGLKRSNQQAKVMRTVQSPPTEEETVLVDALEDLDYESLGHSIEEVGAVERHQSNTNQSHDIGVQVYSDFILPKFTEFLTTDTQLNIATGIETMDILETIVDITKTVSKDHLNRSGGKLSLRDKIVMVYVKLKQNIPFAFLGIMFNGYTVKHCRRIFFETLSMLSKCLKVAVSWQSKEETSQNMLKCFQHFEDVRVVLNFMKIVVQQPKELIDKNSTPSHEKNSNAYKIITGLTPAGDFSFISDLYPNGMSEDDIFNRSRIMSLLEPGDALMMDKGSQYIDELCEINNCKCIRPPLTKNKKPISQADVLFMEKISKALSHIKRSNQRIRTFKIVTDKVPKTLFPRVNEFITVICATLNLSSPIIRDEEFIVIEQLNE